MANLYYRMLCTSCKERTDVYVLRWKEVLNKRTDIEDTYVLNIHKSDPVLFLKLIGFAENKDWEVKDQLMS